MFFDVTAVLPLQASVFTLYTLPKTGDGCFMFSPLCFRISRLFCAQVRPVTAIKQARIHGLKCNGSGLHRLRSHGQGSRVVKICSKSHFGGLFKRNHWNNIFFSSGYRVIQHSHCAKRSFSIKSKSLGFSFIKAFTEFYVNDFEKSIMKWFWLLTQMDNDRKDNSRSVLAEGLTKAIQMAKIVCHKWLLKHPL